MSPADAVWDFCLGLSCGEKRGSLGGPFCRNSASFISDINIGQRRVEIAVPGQNLGGHSSTSKGNVGDVGGTQIMPSPSAARLSLNYVHCAVPPRPSFLKRAPAFGF